MTQCQLPGGLTPLVHEMLVRFSGWMPIAKAAEFFEDFLGVNVSISVSHRYAEEAGAGYEILQDELDRFRWNLWTTLLALRPLTPIETTLYPA